MSDTFRLEQELRRPAWANLTLPSLSWLTVSTGFHYSSSRLLLCDEYQVARDCAETVQCGYFVLLLVML